jgi:hypothetical protein
VTSFIPWNRDYPSTETLQLVAERVVPAFRGGGCALVPQPRAVTQ